MILSDRDIRRRLEKGDVVIEPLDDPELQIQPASVDLRLGSEFLEFNNMRYGCIHPNRQEEVQSYTTSTKFFENSQRSQTELQSFDEKTKQVVPSDEEYILHQDEFVLGTTLERVEIPPDLIAHVEGRSSLGRLAILVHATAGVVDPGFKGQITLELSNLGKAPVALQPGMRISQLTFTQLSSEAERPYGKGRGSKYQGQKGPQSSRIEGDKEFGGDQ